MTELLKPGQSDLEGKVPTPFVPKDPNAGKRFIVQVRYSRKGYRIYGTRGFASSIPGIVPNPPVTLTKTEVLILIQREMLRDGVDRIEIVRVV